MGDSIPTITLPPVNVDSLLQADLADTTGLPIRIGFGHQVSLTTINSGIWETLPDSSRLWRLRVVSNNALCIRLDFDEFELISDADLFVYDESKTEVIGAFTTLNNRSDGKFATTSVNSDSIIIELYEPSSTNVTSELRISSVSHIYRGFGNSLYDCQLNVGCTDEEAGYPISTYADQIRSVAKIIFNMSGHTYSCSGALINNSENLGGLENQYFLTARHCMTDDVNYADFATMEFLFNYQSELCEDEEILSGNEPVYNSLMGSELLSLGSEIDYFPSFNDFALLNIVQEIPESFDVYYSGWSLNLEPTSSEGIHHPRGDIKKISFDNEPPNDPYVPLPPEGLQILENGEWNVHFDTGGGEPGTSGSPLFNQDRKIIGIASWGFFPEGYTCSNTHSINYRQIYSSFNLENDCNSEVHNNLSCLLNPGGLYTEINGRDWWQIFGCTDPAAYNYNPNATNDNGSCYGEKGDINLDECVNVIDITLLVDMILQGTTYDGDIYEHWAADITSSEPGETSPDEQINSSDLTELTEMILNNPPCTGTQRMFTSSFINISQSSDLSRSEGEQVEIIMANQEDIRASRFDFLFAGYEVLNVELYSEYNYMTSNWTTRGDTLTLLIFGAEGQSIPAGSHTLGFITLSSNLGRKVSISPDYFYGEYSNSGYDLFSFEYTQDLEDNSTLPDEYRLFAPYPNPFNATVTIIYDIPENSRVQLIVFDLQGRMVDLITNSIQNAGSYQVNWSADELPSGVYFVRLKTDSYQTIQKLMLLK